MSNNFKQPGIFYEENQEGLSAGFPFMELQKNESIPNVLFIGAVQDTNERISEDSSETIKEIVMQSYYNSESLKKVLDEETYDKVKISLGLKKEN